MEFWINIIKDLGLPIALVLAVGWFINKKVWPFLVNIVSERDKEIKRQSLENTEMHRQMLLQAQKYTDALTKISSRFDQTIDKALDQMQVQDQLFKDLHATVMNGNTAIMEKLIHIEQQLNYSRKKESEKL